jgi:predicted metal-dependent enzyme (double-stranded beta helix superfamily)
VSRLDEDVAKRVGGVAFQLEQARPPVVRTARTPGSSMAQRRWRWDASLMFQPVRRTASAPDAFAEFTRAADALVDDPHAVAERLALLLRQDGWLAPQHQAPGADTYRQHLLHVSPCRRLSVVSLVWRPGQRTAIHDHVSWCVVGVLRGVEREDRFELDETGGRRALRPAGTVYAGRGHVEALEPPGDIHAVTAGGRGIAISMHVYGADISRLGSSIHRRYDEVPILRD